MCKVIRCECSDTIQYDLLIRKWIPKLITQWGRSLLLSKTCSHCFQLLPLIASIIHLIYLLLWQTSKPTAYLSFLSHSHMHYLRSHVHTHLLSHSPSGSISTFPEIHTLPGTAERTKGEQRLMALIKNSIIWGDWGSGVTWRVHIVLKN